MIRGTLAIPCIGAKLARSGIHHAPAPEMSMQRFDSIGLSRQGANVLVWMCVLISANQLGFGAIVPVIALYAEDFGVTQTAIGLTVAVYGLARFLVSLPAGRLSDILGRKPTLAIGGALTCAGTIGCALAPSYELFLLARFVAGAGASCVMTAGQIVLADIATPSNRGRVMSIYQGVFLFSVGAGAFPGGWLADHYGLASPFWANAALAGIVTVLALLFVPETRGLRSVGTGAATAMPGFADQLRIIGRQPGFILICLISFAAFFARTGGLFSVMPLIAEKDMGLSPDQIGVGLGMISIMGLVLVYPSGALVDRFGRKAVIVPASLLTGIAILGYGVATTFGAFMVCSLIWSAASGVSGAAPAAYAADVAPSHLMAPTMGLYRALADAGYVVGPLTLGIVADVASPDAALWVTSVLLVTSSMLFALRAPETLVKHRPPSPPPPVSSETPPP
jgi:DHA1 family multidrug resistance protein-like MFS transporter